MSCFPDPHTDGPYNLEVNSGQGLRTGEVFTINPGELVFFECQADSNPPNSYVWISKNHNVTQIITEGPLLEVRSYKLAQTEEYMCRAFNNVTKKQDEAQFTLVVASFGRGGWRAENGKKEKSVGWFWESSTINTVNYASLLKAENHGKPLMKGENSFQMINLSNFL